MHSYETGWDPSCRSQSALGSSALYHQGVGDKDTYAAFSSSFDFKYKTHIYLVFLWFFKTPLCPWPLSFQPLQFAVHREYAMRKNVSLHLPLKGRTVCLKHTGLEKPQEQRFLGGMGRDTALWQERQASRVLGSVAGVHSPQQLSEWTYAFVWGQ